MRLPLVLLVTTLIGVKVVGKTVDSGSASLRRCPWRSLVEKKASEAKVPDAIDLLIKDDLVKRDLSHVRHGCILAELTRHHNALQQELNQRRLCQFVEPRIRFKGAPLKRGRSRGLSFWIR